MKKLLTLSLLLSVVSMAETKGNVESYFNTETKYTEFNTLLEDTTFNQGIKGEVKVVDSAFSAGFDLKSRGLMKIFPYDEVENPDLGEWGDPVQVFQLEGSNLWAKLNNELGYAKLKLDYGKRLTLEGNYENYTIPTEHGLNVKLTGRIVKPINSYITAKGFVKKDIGVIKDVTLTAEGQYRLSGIRDDDKGPQYLRADLYGRYELSNDIKFYGLLHTNFIKSNAYPFVDGEEEHAGHHHHHHHHNHSHAHNANEEESLFNHSHGYREANEGYMGVFDSSYDKSSLSESFEFGVQYTGIKGLETSLRLKEYVGKYDNQSTQGFVFNLFALPRVKYTGIKNLSLEFTGETYFQQKEYEIKSGIKKEWITEFNPIFKAKYDYSPIAEITLTPKATLRAVFTANNNDNSSLPNRKVFFTPGFEAKYSPYGGFELKYIGEFTLAGVGIKAKLLQAQTPIIKNSFNLKYSW